MHERAHVCGTLCCVGSSLTVMDKLFNYDYILDVRMGIETRFFRREIGGYYSRKVWSEFIVHIHIRL